MPIQSGGAQNLRVGDRVQVDLNSCYRHFLAGLTGRVTCVLTHGVVVALDNDPTLRQRVIGTGGVTGPKNPTLAQRIFQYHEVIRIDP